VTVKVNDKVVNEFTWTKDFKREGSFAHNVLGEEFGEARMQALVREVAPLPVQQISSRLVAELQTWMKGAAQYDDLTFVLVKMNA
jgi:serine phosphatase RsbU (regulator of sigma subunit)